MHTYEQRPKIHQVQLTSFQRLSKLYYNTKFASFALPKRSKNLIYLVRL